MSHDDADDAHEHRPAQAHSHGHVHGGGARAGARHAGKLRLSFILIVAFLVVQVVVGLATNSLALLSDAGHMATDALGMGMALAAISAANRETTADHRTFGLYRLEILAALANAVLLFAVAGYVLIEAVRRFSDGPHIATTPVLVVGVLGLAVNVVSFVLLREGAKESLNLRGAYLEVVSDMLGSVGVIAAAIVMRITDWGWVDPVVGAAIGLFILPRAWRLGRDALRVLVQAAPEGIEIGELRDALLAQPGVAGVHDLHVWTLTSEMDVLTAHLVVAGGHTTQAVLDGARTLLQDRFGLAHATLQVESVVDHTCDDVDW
ncbi:MAG: cation transporter [Ilumatobacteraceae bacterium]|nr:cation transporter [Ilumatobacteraceae bacterium]